MVDNDQEKIILIADPDREVLRSLGNALHDQGYDVRAALDGSKALEKAILVHPALILFDENCPLISATKFIQILRSNPRTEDIPVIVMIGEDAKEDAGWGYREASIRKPFNNDEFLSLVASTFRKMATAKEVREEAREIQGNLSQISLVDLIQIFNLNRRTGLLEIKSEELEGHLYVREGNITHASTGRHSGEKALFRLLQWKAGSFAFIPEEITGDINIRRSSDVLLLEGARQIDELEQLRSDLPADHVRLVPVPELKERYEGLHPVTQEIMNLLEFYNTVGGLVEHSRVSDFEACRAIRTLLDKGVLQVAEVEEEEPEDQAPLLPHDIAYELKSRIAAAMKGQSRITRAKVCLICPVEDLLKDFVNGMNKLPGMELAGQVEALKRGFGQLGTLFVSENFMLDWMLLPAGNSMRPLWHPLGVGMVGGLVMHSSQDDQILYRLSLLAQELSTSGGVPVLQVTPKSLSAALDDGGAAVESSRLSPAKIREAIIGLLKRVGSQGLEKDDV